MGELKALPCGAPKVSGTVLLQGIAGSTAYGLAGPHSDFDHLGIFAMPTVALFGIDLGIFTEGKAVRRTDPDYTFHEVGKAVRILLGVNPTLTELLWLPDELYEVRTPLGDELIGLRESLLSAQQVRGSYLDYAVSQFRKLERRGDGSFSADTRKRTAKHARHLARLIDQGVLLHGTGELMVTLNDPQWYLDFGERVADGDVDEARKKLAFAAEVFNDVPSALPEHPDAAAAEAWLRRVRLAYLG